MMSWLTKHIKHLFSFFMIVISIAGYSQDTFEDIYQEARHELSLELALRAYDVADSLRADSLIAKSAYLVGYTYKKNTDYFNALNYFFQAMKQYRKLNDLKRLADVIDNVGNAYLDCGFSKPAEKYFLDAIELREKIGDIKGKNWSIYNLGRLYGLAKNKGRALEHLFQSLEYFESKQDQDAVTKIANEIGIVYYDAGDLASAKVYYKKAIYADEPESYAGDIEVLAYNNLGIVARDQGDTTKATEYFNLAIHDPAATEHSRFLGYTNLGRLIPERIDLVVKGIEYGMKCHLEYSEYFVQSCDYLIHQYIDRNDFDNLATYAMINSNTAVELVEIRKEMEKLFKRYQVESATYKSKCSG